VNRLRHCSSISVLRIEHETSAIEDFAQHQVKDARLESFGSYDEAKPASVRFRTRYFAPWLLALAFVLIFAVIFVRATELEKRHKATENQ
jgi:hypothetical protein